jgi:hypothetical protein
MPRCRYGFEVLGENENCVVNVKEALRALGRFAVRKGEGLLDEITIAVGRQIRELARLRKAYGPGRWRKRKGIARIRLEDGTIRLAEVHWYEAHGIGRKELKIKRLFPEIAR